MVIIRNFKLIFLVTILFATSCGDQTSKSINNKSRDNLVDFSSIKNKFKYADLVEFSIDTIQWENRKYFYAKLDSLEFFQINQDTISKQYLGQDSASLDLDFFYSKQKSKRGLMEFTILTQRESVYCDNISYTIFDLNGKLISSFRVAGSCGDGGYYETASGKFLNDSTYELLSEDNYKTDDIDRTNIITFSKTITIIKPNGKIFQTDKTLRIDTIKLYSK